MIPKEHRAGRPRRPPRWSSARRWSPSPGRWKPVIFGINAFANTLLKLLRVEPKDEVEAVFTDDQLARMVVDASEAGLLTPADGERLRDAGTGHPPGRRDPGPGPEDAHGRPRSPGRAGAHGRRGGLLRFPVTGPGGTVLGYLHIKDTLGLTDRDRPFPRTALHRVTRVRIDTPLDDTLTALRTEDSHLAAVTGETGAVLGFVTMEDVLTELVGPTTPVA